MPAAGGAGRCAAGGLRRWLDRLVLILAAVWLVAAPAAAYELATVQALRTADQGVLLSFEARFELPPVVEDALLKGVALHFVAEAELRRSRWYWRDKRVAEASRTWRLSYQPLTFSYRLSLGGLSQSYRSLTEALGSMQRASRWRIADPLPDDGDPNYYIDFSYRLDAEQLPRPLQIGIATQPEWTLRLEQRVPVPAETR